MKRCLSQNKIIHLVMTSPPALISLGVSELSCPPQSPPRLQVLRGEHRGAAVLNSPGRQSDVGAQLCKIIYWLYLEGKSEVI